MKTNLQMRWSLIHPREKVFHFFQLYLLKFLPLMLIYLNHEHYFKVRSLILVCILNTNTNLLDFQPNRSSVLSHQSQHQHHFELLLLEP